MPDPLDRLFADRGAINRDLLAEALKEKIWLDRGSQTFHFFPGVRDRLGKARSLLVALLAQKALALATDGEKEGLSPVELQNATGFKGGTVRPALQQLKDSGIITKRQATYIVADAMLERSLAFLDDLRKPN